MTTAEAAAILQVTRRRVNELIKLGTLVATMPGRDWDIDPASVEAYKNSPRKAGPKPKKNRSGGTANGTAQSDQGNIPQQDAQSQR